MHAAALRLELRLRDCTNRRQKRRLMHEILDKLRRHFPVALAEVDRDDEPDTAALGVAVVAATRRVAEETLDRVVEAVAAHPRLELVRATVREI
ncbi:MAG: DUF503 family protein [Isosphaeraceae bacterium]